MKPSKWKVIAGIVIITAVLLAQQPVVVQAPLPALVAGAATIGAVNQATSPWIVAGGGTAGSPGTAVLTVQGVASGTAIPISGTITATIGPSTSSSYALSLKHSSSAAAGSIKASAGNLYGLTLGNSGTVPCWLQLFNTAGTPTAGTSVIDSVMVQAGLTVIIPPGVIAYENFATGIGYAGATADSGATTTGCTTTFSVSAYYN
jgi:hypothetical protein